MTTSPDTARAPHPLRRQPLPLAAARDIDPDSQLRDDQVLVPDTQPGPVDDQLVVVQAGTRNIPMRVVTGGTAVAVSEQIHPQVALLGDTVITWRPFRAGDRLKLVFTSDGLKVLLPGLVAILTLVSFLIAGTEGTEPYQQIAETERAALHALAAAPPTASSVPAPDALATTGQLGITPDQPLAFPVIDADDAAHASAVTNSLITHLNDDAERRAATAASAATQARNDLKAQQESGTWWQQPELYIQLAILAIALTLALIGYLGLGPRSRHA